MKIDTRYTKDGDALVDIVLETAAEHALTDDQLARIGVNQDRLRWPDDGNNVALPDEDPSGFPLPADHGRYVVFRNSSRVTVSYGPPRAPAIRSIAAT